MCVSVNICVCAYTHTFIFDLQILNIGLETKLFLNNVYILQELHGTSVSGLQLLIYLG